MYAKNVIRAVVCAAIVLVLGSCSEPWDDNAGTVIINMEAIRGAQRQADNENDIKYKITFSGKSGKKELKAEGGTIIKTTLAAGIWKIDVEVSLNGRLYIGSDVVEVKAGQTVHKDDIILKYTCVHQWDEVERTPATCSAKGKIEYICLLDASHTKTVEIDIDPNAHNFINPEITPATCDDPGEEKGTCTICGNEAIKILYALGHDYIYAVNFHATCTTPGEETGTCSHDPSHTVPRVIPIDADAHDWEDDWKVTKYITITHDGEETDACNHNPAHKRTRAFTEVPTFTTVADLGTYLAGIPETTAADAYKVKLNVANLTSPTNIRTTLGGGTGNGKYVYLDLSGSTMTSIANDTFYGSGSPYGTATLAGITIPDGVISIGNNAFASCANLASVNIPNNLTSIGTSAFTNCTGLTGSITIPNGVTSIGANAFTNCTGLTGNITIPNSVTSIGANAFRNCSNITSVTLPTNNANFTTIENQTFDGCTSLTSINIPNSVTSIVNGFIGCTSLRNITIKTDKVTIGEGNNWLTKFPADNLVVTFEDVTSIGGNYAFYSNSANNRLKSVTIPDGVNTIGQRAFTNCASLASVTIPNSVTTIGDNAFSGCTSLASVTMPNNLTSIGGAAFSGCSSLTGSITIPNSVTSIGTHAFMSCSSLTSVTLPTNLGFTTIGNQTFDGCTSLTTITIPNSVTSIVNGFLGCTSLRNITIKTDNVTNINWLNTFPATELVVTFEDVTSIGNDAFYSNSANNRLKSVTIPDSVTSIGQRAFSNCTGLTGSLTIPNGVTSIGSNAFYSCTKLESVTLPATNANFTTIADNTFASCTSLVSVTIPNTVTSIGQYAFYNCTSLTSVTFASADTAIASVGNSFPGDASLRTVYTAGGEGTYTRASGGTVWTKED